MQKTVAALLALSMLVMSGCASIISKSDYPVSFSSSPSGAKITITDMHGTQIFSGTTPTQVSLKSGAGYFSGAKYTITYEKPDCEPQTLVLEKQIDGWYVANILFGGLIGLLIVDPATGAMWKLPDHFNANLVEKATTLTDGRQQMQIASLDDIPESMKKSLIKL